MKIQSKYVILCLIFFLLSFAITVQLRVTSTADSEVTQESVEPQQENLDEYNEENIKETTNNQRTNNSNYYESNLNNVDNDDLISIIGALGFFATGIGIGYKVKKK